MKARDAALDTLVRIYEGQAFSNLEIKKLLKEDKVRVRDRNFYIRLVYGTLQWQHTIDIILKHYIKRGFDDLKPQLKAILSIAVYQLLFLNHHPAYAIINEAVKQTKKWARYRSSFVNGVLRNIERDREQLLKDIKNSKNLSLKTSIEGWILRKYLEYNEEEALKMFEDINEPPPVTIRVKPEKLEEVYKELEELGAEPQRVEDYKDVPLSKEALFIKNPSKIEGGLTNLNSYKKGYMTIQNIGSMIISEVLDPQSGDIVLDMCAAPGGKTTHIAELMNNEGAVIAGDIYPKRLELIRNNANRLHDKIVKPFLADGTKNLPDFNEKFDKILVDAPCSGLGIIRRKPDIRLKASEGSISELNKTQLEILENAYKYLKPEGEIVYSTCTVGKDENQDIVRKLIEKYPQNVELINEENLYNINGSGDAFYYAKLKKKN